MTTTSKSPRATSLAHGSVLDRAVRGGRATPLSRLSLGLAAAALGSLSACGGAVKGPNSASDRPPLAQKWLDRAKADYANADIDDAWDAVKSALQAAPGDVEVKTWAGRVALARLEYAEVIQLLQGVDTTEARGLRGRAEWYAGDIDAAADELEAMLRDPDVRDGWAKATAQLARRGVGRKPFAISGGLLAVSEMPHVPAAGSTSTASTAMVVPVEIDGEQALAMVATGTAEVTLDSATRKEPSWVSLRFAGRLEVKDVPAMVQDLAGVSKQINAPIKALLGINLLRHLNATIDFLGEQFVVRTFASPVPPRATRVELAYLKGGGMVVRTPLRQEHESVPAALLVDTSMSVPLALDEGGWKKAGIGISSLSALPQDSKLKQGVVPLVRLGTFDVPQVPAVFGAPISEIERGVEADLDGVIGSGLLAPFRVTFADDGRVMWLEDATMPAEPSAPSPAPAAPEGAVTPATPGMPAGAGSAAPAGAPAATPPRSGSGTGKGGRPAGSKKGGSRKTSDRSDRTPESAN